MRNLVTCVCVPLALLLIVYNLNSYSTLTATYNPAFSAKTQAERRRMAQMQSASRSRFAHSGGAGVAAALDQGDDTAPETLEPAEAQAAEESLHADAAIDGGAAANPEAGPDATAAMGGVDGTEASLAEAAASLGEAHADAEAADPADPAETAAAGGGGAAVVETVMAVGESVLLSAVDTANAAAGVVTRVRDSLAAAAGNSACKPKTPDWEQRPLNFVAPVESKHWPVGCRCVISP